MTAYAFSQVAGLGSHFPEAPPELRGSINDFGFTSVMKRLHRSIKSCLNRIPKVDPNTKVPMRDHFLRCIAMDLSDQQAVEKFCSKLGFESALRDLTENRISEMTVVDFIIDKAMATPDSDSFSRVKDDVLREDRER